MRVHPPIPASGVLNKDVYKMKGEGWNNRVSEYCPDPQ